MLKIQAGQKEQEEQDQSSGNDTSHGVIIPLRRKKLKKILMFYYISKKYPKFVRHLLRAINENHKRVLLAKKKKQKMKEVKMFSNSDRILSNFFHGSDPGEAGVESDDDDDVGKIDRIMSHLVDTGIQHVLDKERKKARERSQWFVTNNSTMDDYKIPSDVAHNDNVQGLVSKSIDGSGPNTTVKGERRKKKIHREFEMLKSLLHRNTSTGGIRNKTDIDISRNMTVNGLNKTTVPANESSGYNKTVVNYTDPYSTFVTGDDSSPSLNRPEPKMLEQEEQSFVANKSDPYATITIHDAKNPPKINRTIALHIGDNEYPPSLKRPEAKTLDQEGHYFDVNKPDPYATIEAHEAKNPPTENRNDSPRPGDRNQQDHASIHKSPKFAEVPMHMKNVKSQHFGRFLGNGDRQGVEVAGQVRNRTMPPLSNGSAEQDSYSNEEREQIRLQQQLNLATFDLMGEQSHYTIPDHATHNHKSDGMLLNALPYGTSNQHTNVDPPVDSAIDPINQENIGSRLAFPSSVPSPPKDGNFPTFPADDPLSNSPETDPANSDLVDPEVNHQSPTSLQHAPILQAHQPLHAVRPKDDDDDALTDPDQPRPRPTDLKENKIPPINDNLASLTAEMKHYARLPSRHVNNEKHIIQMLETILHKLSHHPTDGPASVHNLPHHYHHIKKKYKPLVSEEVEPDREDEDVPDHIKKKYRPPLSKEEEPDRDEEGVPPLNRKNPGLGQGRRAKYRPPLSEEEKPDRDEEGVPPLNRKNPVLAQGRRVRVVHQAQRRLYDPSGDINIDNVPPENDGMVENTFAKPPSVIRAGGMTPPVIRAGLIRAGGMEEDDLAKSPSIIRGGEMVEDTLEKPPSIIRGDGMVDHILAKPQSILRGGGMVEDTAAKPPSVIRAGGMTPSLRTMYPPLDEREVANMQQELNSPRQGSYFYKTYTNQDGLRMVNKEDIPQFMTNGNDRSRRRRPFATVTSEPPSNDEMGSKRDDLDGRNDVFNDQNVRQMNYRKNEDIYDNSLVAVGGGLDQQTVNMTPDDGPQSTPLVGRNEGLL